jgi:hypothetical protein
MVVVVVAIFGGEKSGLVAFGSLTHFWKRK